MNKYRRNSGRLAFLIVCLALAGAEVPCNGPKKTDTDNDGILDVDDNCPEIANADQLDTDGDRQGDACDSDDDNDGILDDGDQSGEGGDNPCEDGQITGCDDNCPPVSYTHLTLPTN